MIEAVVSIIGARVTAAGGHVYAHRKLSLSSDENQLPAISVDFGEDQRADTKLIGSIGSILSVQTTAVVTALLEQDIRLQLLSLRREIHRAVMADARLGLSFVINTLYGGAGEPEIMTDGESIVGALTSTWLAYYQMNLQDPGDD